MSNPDVRMRLLAENQASGKINQVDNDLKRLDGSVAALSRGLGGIGAAVGYAGLGVLAAKAGKAILSLNAMREESEQIEARFIGLGGGAAKATESLSAMDAAVGLAMTRDEKMAAVAQITTLELTKSAAETATLAKQALVLGDATQSASQRIETLTGMLVTGRLMGLREYGISAAIVTARAEELQRVTIGLSDIEAKQIAIKEQLAIKTNAVADAGGLAATQSQEMANAWEDMKDALADTVNASIVIRVITKAVKALTPEAGEGESFWTQNILGEGGSNTERYRLAKEQVTVSQNRYNVAMAGGSTLAKELARNELAQAQAAASAAFSIMKEAAGIMDVHDAARAAVPAIDALAQAQLDAAAAAEEWNAKNYPLADRFQGGTSLFDQWQSNLESSPEWEAHEKLLKKIAAAEEDAAEKVARKWQAEFEKVSGNVEGMIRKAMNASKGLTPGGGGQDMFAPGANGPFENLFRAKDVAVHGEASPWAKVLGLDQESAKKISSDFEHAIFSEGVLGLIDTDALANEVHMAQVAEASLDAFSKQIAKKAGISDFNFVETVITGKDATGKSSKAEEGVTAGLDAMKSAFNAQTADATFLADLSTYGVRIWSGVEAGVIKQAKGSATFKSAIAEMVASVLASETE